MIERTEQQRDNVRRILFAAKKMNARNQSAVVESGDFSHSTKPMNHDQLQLDARERMAGLAASQNLTRHLMLGVLLAIVFAAYLLQ